jgi:hypothetical protein
VGGILIPIGVEIAERIHPYEAGAWLLWIWPSSIGLMALDDAGLGFGAVMAFATLAAINALLYAGSHGRLRFGGHDLRAFQIKPLWISN